MVMYFEHWAYITKFLYATTLGEYTHMVRMYKNKLATHISIQGGKIRNFKLD